jgi:hypothetical protein
MKALLAVIVLLLVGITALACYRGWVHFSRDGADANPNVTLEVDKAKIEADKEKVEGLGQRVKEKAGGATDTAKETAKE